jgi:hypothetical protein
MPGACCLLVGLKSPRVVLLRLFLLIFPRQAMHQPFLRWVFHYSFPIFRWVNLLLFIVYTGELSFLLIYLWLQDFVDGVSAQLRSCGAAIPDQALSLMRWNPLLLEKQIDDLKASNAG